MSKISSQIVRDLDSANLESIAKKLESIEEYEKRFLTSLENLNSSSLLKPNLKLELTKKRPGQKLDLMKPKFLLPLDNQTVTSSKSRYDRIRSRSSHSRHRSRHDKNDSNLSSVESKSLNLLSPVMKRSASSHSTYEANFFNSKNSLSSPMSSSHSLNSNWYKPKSLQKPANTTKNTQSIQKDSAQELDLNEKPKMAESQLDVSEEYDNLTELNQSVELPDYQQKSNVQSFIILNESGASLTEHSFNLQQVSEDFDEQEMEDSELRTYDDDYNCNYQNSEDEFFLISSPFVAEDTDPTLRSNPMRYETNRLSNIIEEDESHNQSQDSDHDDFKQMLELSKQVTDGYKNIQNELNYKPVVKKRVYNLNRTYYEKSDENEEEPESILSYLIERLSEQHQLDLKKLDTTSRYDQMEQDLLSKYILPQKDSEFLLTKSLYAQNKTITENNKMITALSINEIETRKSICLDDNEDNEEKKIKEEIVLIGEKSDIDSLLDNENNQLYNLLMANSSRVNQLTNLESSLNKKRLDGLRQIKPMDEDVEIEIQLGDSDQSEQENEDSYESELKNVAKYLVDEITKISLNKVKIDYLNEKYESKNLNVDKFFDREIENVAEKENKHDLVEYYRNLEKNLHQVRSEIDKLKKEAVEDLAYLSKVLDTEELDIEDFYLNNDEARTDTDTEYLSQSTINHASSQIYLTPAESFSKHDDNTLTNPTDAESEHNDQESDLNHYDLNDDLDDDDDDDETKLTVKELDVEEDKLEEKLDADLELEEPTLKNQIEDLSHLVKNILSSRPSFKIETLEAKFEPKKQTLHPVDKKSVENLLKLASNSASLLNLNAEHSPPLESKPAVKPRQKKNFESQLTSLIQSSKLNSASTNFRVPSSRHFCGRLMSVSQQSVSSCSSSSSASMTNTNEEISIETDSTESPSPISSSPNSHYNHQRNMAKSVEFLGSKIEDIKKEKSLVDLIDAATMSKSNKDLRSFVSNSYSPSQIIRPDNQQPAKKPMIMNPPAVLAKPLKDHHSDQIRLQYLQQEQIISKMEKKKLNQYMQIKTGYKENRYQQEVESDETLINCILEMKPLPSNKSKIESNLRAQPQPQPRNSSQQNAFKNSSLSSYSLSSNSNSNSNRNSINQDNSFRKESYGTNNSNKANSNYYSNSRPLFSSSSINKIYSNNVDSSSRSPQYNLLSSRNEHLSSRTVSSNGTSANSINQQRTRPYTPRSTISVLPDNLSGRIKKETNL